MTEKGKPDAAGSDGAKKSTSKAPGKPAKVPKAKELPPKEVPPEKEQPPKPESPQSERDKIQADARALLEAERKAVADADIRNPVLPSIRKNPLGCATILKDRFFTKNALPQVAYYRENWYCYYEDLWAARTEDDMDHFVHHYLSECRTVDGEGELIEFVTSRANVSEVRFQLGNVTTVPSHYLAPVQHLKKPKMKELKAKGKMVTLGQITDMLTLKQWSNQTVFIPNGASWTFDKKAAEPKVWHEFLHDLFADRTEDIELLQEWIGYVLSGDTWAQKGLLIVGPKRAGKGVIGGVLTALLGESMMVSPALKKIGENFGLENMVDKRLCLISDARLSNRADTMSVIEMLLRIIANDPVDITRKNKGALTLKLGTRVTMLANSRPQLGDDSDAITSRFLILNLIESFYGREDTKLAEKLERELAGIALWAIEGYKRLIARGKFAEPQSSVDARAEWYVENNPVAEFLEDWGTLGPDESVTNDTLFDAYREWSEAKGLTVLPSQVLSRKIGAMLGPKIKRVKGDKVRRIEGLGLKKRSF